MSRKSIWAEKSGLENLRNILAGREAFEDPMGQTLNIALVAVAKGVVSFEGTPGQHHLNPRGSVHGGWAMSIMDSAAVLAVVSALPKGKLCATSTFEIKFARPIKVGMTCRAEGEVVSQGSNLAHAKAKLIDCDTGKLLAFCTCSASVFDIDE